MQPRFPVFREFLTALAVSALAGSAVAGDLVAWDAAKQMGIGVNIGNTLENTTHWETGWGNPKITKDYVESLAKRGFRTVRLPVAWDTYARDGKIDRAKLKRVGEVVDWILGAGMFCVVNIHWDGGWIDSSNKEKFARTYATFNADAERKFPAYWTQIASYVADLSQQMGFSVVNLLESLRPFAQEELLYYRDDHHWNERGNAIVSQLIAQALGHH
jgi:hypothetical protein